MNKVVAVGMIVTTIWVSIGAIATAQRIFRDERMRHDRDRDQDHGHDPTTTPTPTPDTPDTAMTSPTPEASASPTGTPLVLVTPTPMVATAVASPSASASPVVSASASPTATASASPTVTVMVGTGVPGEFGGIVMGASVADMGVFAVGQAQFQHVDGLADGLGPIFNGQSCVQCHTQPVVNGMITTGGASPFTETHAMIPGQGQVLIHQACITQSVQDSVPFDAIATAQRRTNPLFGDGLIEAIPDAEIIAGVKSGVDGITGRPAMLNDSVTTTIANGGFFNAPSNLIGRFGWKAQEATLLAFSGDAYLNEIGVTNRFFSPDIAPHFLGGEPPDVSALQAAEPAGITPDTLQDTPDDPNQPESMVNQDDLDRFTGFMQLLAPAPTVPLTQSAQLGQQLFTSIGCVECHTPSMMTGQSKISAALSFKPVPLYSDLLLHDMGSLGDGISQGAAGPTEMRTAPLWGLRARTAFLHDGRATTVLRAIQDHTNSGEATVVAGRFNALSDIQQQEIIDFLNSI